MVISLAFVKTSERSGEKNEGITKVGEVKSLLMFSRSNATGQSRMDASGWQSGHSRCCSGLCLLSSC